jgi:hypothetical protein
VRLEVRIRSIEKSSDLIGHRNRDLPACSIVLHPTTLPRAPKVNLPLFSIYSAPLPEDPGGRGIAPPFLTSALDGDEWSASCTGRFTTDERATDTHCIGG